MGIDFIKNMKLLKPLILLPAILFLGCTSSTKQSDEIMLARIGDKKISVKEFLRRSELTIRPQNFKSKKTALNNLISEKILALEAEQHKVTSLPSALQSTLKGIKEQLMRDQLYQEIAFKKIQTDSQEISHAYKLSMREYALEFFTLLDKQLAEKITAKLDSAPQLADQMFKEVEEFLNKKPIQKVKYQDPEDDAIHEALFTKPLDPGAVIGPLKLGNGDHIVIKVLNWIDYPVISDVEQQARWQEVQKKIHQTKALKLWRSYQADVMKGKKIEFDERSFKILSDWAMEQYLSRDQNDTLNPRVPEITSVEPQINLDAPLFKLDDKLWTVSDFKTECNFAAQFQLAIADMLRDHFLTQEAYEKSLNDSEEINQTVALWKDAFLADYQKTSIIQSALKQVIIDTKDKPGVMKYWESYILNLQKKYRRSIKINYDEFEQIKLTNIDFVGMRPGVPYPMAVPGFPTLIASENLDY